MKNNLIIAAAFFVAEAFGGFLPPSQTLAGMKVDSSLSLQEGEDYTDEQLQEYEAKLAEWESWISNMETAGGVNLNVFNSAHKK